MSSWKPPGDARRRWHPDGRPYRDFTEPSVCHRCRREFHHLAGPDELGQGVAGVNYCNECAPPAPEENAPGS